MEKSSNILVNIWAKESRPCSDQVQTHSLGLVTSYLSLFVVTIRVSVNLKLKCLNSEPIRALFCKM